MAEKPAIVRNRVLEGEHRKRTASSRLFGGLAATLDPQRLRLDRRLVLAFSVLIAIALAACVQSVWLARQVAYYSERSRLADQVLIGYHRLKSLVLELNSSLGEVAASESQLAHEAELVGSLEGVIAEIRQTLTSEVLLVGHEEAEELAALARIERLIGGVFNEFRSDDLGTADRRSRTLARLRAALAPARDDNLRLLIAREIREESEEAVLAEQRLSSLSGTSARLAVMLGSLGLLFGSASLVVLVRAIRRPLASLVDGTEAIARGQLSHRIEVAGTDEFAHLARSFNTMAEDLARKNDTVTRSAMDLEETIAQRTLELKAANEKLEQSDIKRRRFLADISHELRTPLTIMRGEAEVALRGAVKTAEEYQNALKRIVEQAAHSGTLVDDLLFLARRESGDARLKQQSTAIVELVARVCDEAATLGADREVLIEFHTSIQEAVIVGDPGRLRQLVLILIDNAVRYSSLNSKVRVEMLPAVDQVVLRVADHGIGIVADEIPRVFERYYRGENAVSLHVEGTGLGLPMAKVIVEAHGGTIELESELGRGTAITVRLPTARRVRAVS